MSRESLDHFEILLFGKIVVKKVQRVLKLSVQVNLIVQVRPGRTAGRAHEANDVALADALARIDVHCGKMTIAGLDGVAMFDLYIFAIARNPLRAADDAWLFKMLVKGLARRHGFAASFMAKPYPEYSGNGLHTHFSVIDSEGRNVFSNGGPEGSDLLRHAVAGCLWAMHDSTLLFAPHANSYERLIPEATDVDWLRMSPAFLQDHTLLALVDRTLSGLGIVSAPTPTPAVISGDAIVQQIRQISRLETTTYSIERVIEVRQSDATWPDWLRGDRLLLIWCVRGCFGAERGDLADQPRLAAVQKKAAFAL